MALPQVQSYRAQVAQAPSAATPRVSFGQPVRADMAVQAGAQYYNTLGQVLDRMSNQLFKVAETQSAQEGLQFAIENPMTSEQLAAMSRGQMPEDLDLGNPLNVFNNAVRKARAIEVSAHFEMEDTQKLLEIADMADRGMINTEDAKGKISAIINASAQVQANIDPDASYKYRASMANYGSRIVDYISKKELEKNRVANTFKVDNDYSNKLGLLAKSLQSPLGINPATNAPWDVTEYLNAHIGNFVNNASSVIGAAEAAKYGQKMRGDIENVMKGAIRQELSNPKYFQDSVETLDRLATGDIDNVRQIAGYFAVQDPKVLVELQSEFRQMVSDRRQQRNDELAEDKRQREDRGYDLLIEFSMSGTSPKRKREIGMELAKLKIHSFEQIQTLLDPNNKGTDVGTLLNIGGRIDNGEITTYDELNQVAAEIGLSREQYTSLGKQLRDVAQNKVLAEVNKRARTFAGLPDQLNAPLTDADLASFAKENRVKEIRDGMVAEFTKTNPGEIPPLRQFQRKAEEEYNRVDAADLVKKGARDALAQFVRSTNERAISQNKPPVFPEGFVITERDNLDEIIQVYKIDPKKRGFLQGQIDVLRKVPQ